jgi:hypothetical protein
VRTTWLVAVAAGSVMAQAAPEVTALQLAKPLVVTAAALLDVDGDGRDDLILACHDDVAKRRELRVHLRAANGPAFRAEPKHPPHVLERDVLAFVFVDVDPRPGRELVLFTAERAVAVLPVEGAAPEYRPLFEHHSVWPAASRERVVDLAEALHDVDGDGREDLVLPEPDGARIVRLRAGENGTTFVATSWRAPERRSPLAAAGGGPARVGGGEFQLRFDLDDGDGDDDADRGPLLQVRTRAPRVTFADLDGDGRGDGVALRNDALWTWPLNDGGGAPAARRLDLPVPEDRLALFDPSFDVQLGDADGDRRADVLLTTSGRRNDEVEVRIDLLLQQSDATTWVRRPDARLRLQTLAKAPEWLDVDGDGRRDVVAVTVRVDMLRRFAEGGGPTTLQAQLNVFRGQPTRFQVPAMLVHLLELPAGKGRPAAPFVHVLPAAAGGTGTLLYRADDRIVLQPLAADDGALQVLEPRWQLPIATTSRPQLAGKDNRELLVVGEHEVLHVRLP